MALYRLKSRNCLNRALRISGCVVLLVITGCLVAPSRVGVYVSNRVLNTWDGDRRVNRDDIGVIDGLDEIVVGDREQAAFYSRKDITGEWFENPMVLRDHYVPKSSSSDERQRLTYVSLDYKLGPILALKQQLAPLGINIKLMSLSPHCQIVESCSKLLEYNSGFRLTKEDIRTFWRLHRNDSALAAADGFVCVYPLALCELFVPFNKSLILVVDGRYELSRTARSRWTAWNDLLLELSEDPRHLLVASNPYDMEYVKFFTGLSLPVVPFACSYVTKRYEPHEPTYLLMPVKKQGFDKIILDGFKKTSEAYNLTGELKSVLSVYGASYTSDDLSRHSGIVVVPHQVSYLAMTEILRMNVPIYMPTVELLARWHVEAGVLTDRTLPTRATNRNSPKPALTGLPDPNDEDKLWAVGFWLTFAEFFSWPVRHFDSVENLAYKLNATTGEDLFYASERLRVYNRQEQTHVEHFWKTAVHKLLRANRS